MHSKLIDENSNRRAESSGESVVKIESKFAKFRRLDSLEMPLATLVVGVALFFGWVNRKSGDLVAESGIGYYLGIIGGSMMLVLLMYPLRKRFRFLRVAGSVRGWFRLHMLLGIFGPALVVLHSNFALGSLNSTVAMTAMLVVAGSGFIGRFLYAQIHRGLYGKKRTLAEMMSEISSSQHETGLSGINEVKAMLNSYQSTRLGQTNSIFRSTMNIITGPFSRQNARRKILRQLNADENVKAMSRKNRRQTLSTLRKNLDAYFSMAARAEAFSFYERMFALWHLLHLPLFFILVFAAFAHVVAVHLY